MLAMAVEWTSREWIDEVHVRHRATDASAAYGTCYAVSAKMWLLVEAERSAHNAQLTLFLRQLQRVSEYMKRGRQYDLHTREQCRAEDRREEMYSAGACRSTNNQ